MDPTVEFSSDLEINANHPYSKEARKASPCRNHYHPPNSMATSKDAIRKQSTKSHKKKADVIDTNNNGMISNASNNVYPSSCLSPGMATTRQSSEEYSTTSASCTVTTKSSASVSDAKSGDTCASHLIISYNSDSTRSNSLDSAVSATIKRHTGGDSRWEAIQHANSRSGPLGLSHFRLLKRLGYGDIGSVYLVELRGTNSFFAMKVMDKASIVSRNKLLRAQTEREILGLLDHPFLPTLYSHFETEKFYCLVMEYCSGGNLHSLRQKQPNKHFTEPAARFFASEVLLALEYLHMLGIVYRDLKPENVLVREEGHIMLSDFDLSLRCSVNPTLVKSSSVHGSGNIAMLDTDHAIQGCIHPSNFFPRIILPKRNRKTKSDFGQGGATTTGGGGGGGGGGGSSSSSGSILEFMAEPTNARSMSFVGTHEYLAPEIIKGEGHGSAVDWWTFGIFLYELMHGTTPFKGSGNRATLFNVVGQPLKFPDMPVVSSVTRDLIRGLLVKDPQKRIAYRRGATEIKQHPFFEGVNWALVRSATPPHVPDPVDFAQYASKDEKKGAAAAAAADRCIKGTRSTRGGSVGGGRGKAGSSNSDSSYLDFEYF